MADQNTGINPSLPAFYGAPTGGESGMIQTRSGAQHSVGGAATTNNKFGHNELPDLTGYLKDRAAFDDPDNPPKALSTLPASDLKQMVMDYGNTHFGPVLESQYRSKVDKGQIESHVNQFTSKFMNDLPRWRQHFADMEKQAGVVAPPAKSSNDLGNLGKSVGGTLESAAAQAVQGGGRVVADALRQHLNTIAPGMGDYVEQKGQEFANKLGTKPGEGVMTDPLRKAISAGQTLHDSVSAEYKAKTGEDAPLSLIKAADVVGNIGAQVAPMLGAAMVNPGLALVSGAGQMGQQFQDQEVQRIMTMKPEEVSKLPAFQKLVSSGISPQDAQKQLAEHAGEVAFKTGASVGTIAGALGAGPITAIGKTALIKVFGKSLVARILGTAGAEGSGQSVLGAIMEGANTNAVNAVTGENREPDLAGAAKRGFEFGAVLGPLGMAAGAKIKPNELKQPAPGEKAPPATEPGAASQAPGAQKVYADLAPAIMEQFKPASKDEAHVAGQMADALDLFQQRAEREGYNEEQVNQLKDQFTQDYKKQFGVSDTVAPQGPASAVNETAVSPEEAAMAAARAKEESQPVPVKPETPEPTPTPEQLLDTHKAALDTRLGDGLLLGAIRKLQDEGKTNPLPDEINAAAHKDLGILMQLTGEEDRFKKQLDETKHREAINKLLEEGKEVTSESVREVMKDLDLNKQVGDRLRTRTGARIRPKKNPLPKSEPVAAGAENTVKTEAAKPEQESSHELGEDANQPVFENLRQEISKLGKAVDKNRLTESGFTSIVRRLATEFLSSSRFKRALTYQNRQRGADFLRERLLNQKRKGNLPEGEAELADWLLRNNPHLANDLAISFSGSTEATASGRYNPALKLIKLFTENMSDDQGTVAHEILHHSEKLMPENIQKGIHTEWANRLKKELQKAAKAGDRKRIDALSKLVTSTFSDIAKEPVNRYFEDGTLKYTDYALKNPSEFWAVNGTEILKNRFNSEYSWAKKAYNWTKELYQKAKGAFGLRSDAPVLKALDNVLKGEGKPLSKQMLAQRLGKGEGQYENISTGSEEWEKPFTKSLLSQWGSGKEEPKTSEPSAWEKFTQKNVNTLKPLEYLNEKMAKLGHIIGEGVNMFMHFTNLPGRQAFEQSRVHADYIEPFKDLVRSIAETKDWTEGKVLRHFSDWVRAMDALETNARGNYEKVKLSDAAEAKRAPLRLQVHEGKLPYDQYMKQLKAIVHAPGAMIERLDSVSPLSGMKRSEAIAKLREANEAGLTDEDGEALNQLLNPLRESIFKDNLESGVFSQPAIDLARAYGAKYYVPKVGFANEDFAQGSSFGSPLGAFTKEAWMQEGRKTLADDPIQNLLRKGLNAAKDVADNEAIKSIYEFASNKELNTVLKATVRTVNMDRLSRDALSGGGSLADIQRASKNPTTVIYNEGKFRHFIDLPEDSPILRAIKESQSPVAQGEAMKAIGKATQLYGRYKTAFSPQFSLVTAPIRDGLYVPGMYILQGKASWVPTYIKNYMSIGGPLGAWKTYLNDFKGVASWADIQKKALANPDGIAGMLYRLDKAGGLTGFRHEFESAKKVESLATELAKDSQSALDPRKVLRYLGAFQDAFASGSINAGRIAAFKTALEHGASEKEAAFLSRRLLDYQQTSQGSRGLNSLFAFSRVGITSLDAMFGALKDADGSINGKRAMAAMALTGVATTALYQILKSYLGDKIKDYTDDTFAKNMVIPNPWGDPITLPIGLGGPRLAWGLSMLTTRLLEGHTTAESAGRAAKNLLLENVSPLHPSEAKEGASASDQVKALASAAVPTVASPIYQAIVNQGHFGSVIHTPEDRTKGFASEAGWSSTADIWKTLAESMRKNTGLDMYPETLNHLVTSYDPGVVNLVLGQMKKANMESAGIPTTASQGTIFSALFSHDLQYAGKRKLDLAQSKLEGPEKEFESLKEKNKELKEQGKPEKPIPSKLQKEEDELKKIHSEESKHSKSVKAVQKNALLSQQAKTAQIKVLNDAWQKRQTELANEANRVIQ